MTACGFVTGEIYLLGSSAIVLWAGLRWFSPKGGQRRWYIPWILALFGSAPLDLAAFFAGKNPGDMEPGVMLAFGLLELYAVCCCFQGPWYRNYVVSLAINGCVSLATAAAIAGGAALGAEGFTYAETPADLPAFLVFLACCWGLTAAGLAVLQRVLPRVLSSPFLRPAGLFLLVCSSLFFLWLVWEYVSLYSAAENLLGQSTPMELLAVLGGMVFPALLGAMVLKLLHDDAAYRRLTREREELDRQLEQQYRYFLSLEESKQELRRLRHDIANHMQTMQIMLERQEFEAAGDYFRQISEEYRGIPPVELCENLVVNAVLSQCWRRCSQEGIALDCQVRCPEEVGVRGIDLMCVLSNLLDNAVEACQRLEPGQERRVVCRARLQGGCLWIQVENTASLEPRGLTWRTSKEDPDRHGLGLEILETVAQRYQGDVLREVLPEGSVRVTICLIPTEISQDTPGSGNAAE